MTEQHTALLATATLAHLTALYNDFAAKAVKGFKDKPTALARVIKLADETGRVPELVDGKVALVTPPPVQPAAPVVVKPARAKAAAKPAKVPGVRGPKPNFAETDVITLVSDKNPKRAGTASYARFALYRTGMTVKEFLDGAAKLQPEFGRGRWRGDLEWDRKYGFITVAPAAKSAVKAA